VVNVDGMIATLSRADEALLISLASLTASFGSLSWQLYSALRVDTARLDVKIEAMSIVGGGQRAIPVIVISATNAGKRPTSLTNLWLQFGRPFRRRHRLIPRRWRRMGALMLHDPASPVPPPTFPCRLDVGEMVSVHYRSEFVRQGLEKQPERLRWLFASAAASTTHGYSRRLSISKLDPPVRVARS
jgi:hypothetical protein